jgi:hypothetical protein
MKVIAFWNMVPCSLPEVDRIIARMLETVRTCETSVYFYDTTRRHIPDRCHLHCFYLTYTSVTCIIHGCGYSLQSYKIKVRHSSRVNLDFLHLTYYFVYPYGQPYFSLEHGSGTQRVSQNSVGEGWLHQCQCQEKVSGTLFRLASFLERTSETEFRRFPCKKYPCLWSFVFITTVNFNETHKAYRQ